MNIAIFLLAIASVESGNNPKAIGQEGERSAYQMTRETWRRYTSDPFEWATSRPDEAKRVATEHAKHLLSMIEKLTGFKDMTDRQKVISLASMWDPGERISYSIHAANLYADFKHRRVVP